MSNRKPKIKPPEARPTLTEAEIDAARGAARQARADRVRAALDAACKAERCHPEIVYDPSKPPLRIAPGIWAQVPLLAIVADDVPAEA